MQSLSPDFKALAQLSDLPEVNAIVLMGSHARSNPGPFNDVDLVRFTREEIIELPGNGSHFIDDRLVVVSDVVPTQVENGFNQPETAVNVIAGLKTGNPLIDKDNTFCCVGQKCCQLF